MPTPPTNSGIRDNHRRGAVADFLKAKIHSGSRLSVVSAYFTIYAYDALREHLDQIDHLDFLFGEPRFIASLDPDKTEKKAFILDGNGLQLANKLQQKRVARDCAEWMRNKVDKNDEIEEIIHEDMRYRDKQLLRLREEVLDLEDFSESVALNEFTLDDFRIELSKYIEANRQLLQDAPLGLYSVVPPHPEHQIIAPGVLFCLKQKGEANSSDTVNPLQPYYLVYVRDDGTVRFGFAQPKQILEIYRLLCGGKATAYEQLCQLFDTETNNGADMSLYNKLLTATVHSIAKTFQKRVAAGLQTSRDFVIPSQSDQATDTTDFDLITWLVIKHP